METTTTTLTADQQDHFFDLACGGRPGLNLLVCCPEHPYETSTSYQRGICLGHDESDIACYYWERAAGYTIGDANAFHERLGHDDGGLKWGAGPFFADQATAEVK